MVIASYLLDKAREKGYAEGYPQDREEAYKDANRQVADYFRRMRAALEAGEDFDEPRPTFGNNSQ